MSQSRRQREVGFREGGRWRQFYGPTAVTDVTRRSSAREFVTRGRFAGHDVMDGFMGNGGMLRPRDQKSSPWKPRKYSNALNTWNQLFHHSQDMFIII